MRQSVEMAVKNKITEHGRGWCFTALDFDDLGSGDSIRHTLFRSSIGKRSFAALLKGSTITPRSTKTLVSSLRI